MKAPGESIGETPLRRKMARLETASIREAEIFSKYLCKLLLRKHLTRVLVR